MDHTLCEALAHVMWVGQMAFQNGHETTEGCGLVYWAGRLSQQVSQSLLNEAAGNHLIVPASIETKLYSLLFQVHTLLNTTLPLFTPLPF